MSNFLRVLSIALLGGFLMSPAAAQSAAELCDELAAHPDDPGKAGEGVPLDDIDAEAALGACRQAVEASPEEPRLRYQLGRALEASGETAEALETFESAAADGYAMAWVSLGAIYESSDGVEQDYAKAAEYYRKAADADLIAGIWNLGNLYDYGDGVEQDAEEAARLFRIGVERGDPYSWVSLGYLLEEGRGVEKDEAEAERLFRLAAESDVEPAANDAKNALAWRRALSGEDLEEAERLAMEVVASDEYASYLDTLGWVRFRMGKLEEAVRDIERAVELDDSQADIHERLGDVYAALGRQDEAKEAWQRALDLPPPDSLAAPDFDRATIEAKISEIE